MARGPAYSRDACVLTTFLNGTERLIHQPHMYIFLDFLLVFFSSLLWISPSKHTLYKYITKHSGGSPP